MKELFLVEIEDVRHEKVSAFHEWLAAESSGLPCWKVERIGDDVLVIGGVEYMKLEETEDVSTMNGVFKCKLCECTVQEKGVDYGMVNYCPDCGKWVDR